MESRCPPTAAKRAEARTGAHVFVGDIPDAPFPPESFDVITCFDVLEHVYEPRRVMAKVREWLKPGGVFYVQVPNIDSAEARVFGTYWHGLELPRHLFHYSPASLRNLATSSGLREVSLVTQRNPAVGTSLRYVWDDVFQAAGIRRTPTAYLGAPSLPWRIARKLVRMTVLRLLSGDGSSRGRRRSHSCGFPEGKGFCVRSMRRSIHQTCAGFEDHEGFFSTRLSERELCAGICKGPRLHKETEIRGPR